MRTLSRIHCWVSGKLDWIAGLSIAAIISASLILGVAVLSEFLHVQSGEGKAKSQWTVVNDKKPLIQQVMQPEIATPFTDPVDYSKVDMVATNISSETMVKAKWVRLIPQIKAYRYQRQLAVEQMSDRLEQILRELQNEISFDSFVEDIQSVTTSVQYMVDSDELVDSMVARFESEIFSENQLQKLFNHAASLLHESLTEIDDAGLVAMEIDTKFDSGTLAQARVQIRIPSISTAGLADELSQHLVEIIQQKVASTAASLAAGAVVEQVFSSEFAYDEYGNYNVAGGLFSMAAGFAAGAVADSVVTDAMDIEDQLRTTLSRGLGEIYSNLTSSQSEWRQGLSTLSLSHDRAFIESIIESIGVDRDWALLQLQ